MEHVCVGRDLERKKDRFLARMLGWIVWAVAVTGATGCVLQDGACVCNASYCDQVPALPNLAADSFAVYSSSKSGQRLSLAVGSMDQPPLSGPTVTLTIDAAQTFQTIVGFGGAFTDAATVRFASAVAPHGC